LMTGSPRQIPTAEENSQTSHQEELLLMKM